jgi:hypothetical protein
VYNKKNRNNEVIRSTTSHSESQAFRSTLLIRHQISNRIITSLPYLICPAIISKSMFNSVKKLIRLSEELTESSPTQTSRKQKRESKLREKERSFNLLPVERQTVIVFRVVDNSMIFHF